MSANEDLGLAARLRRPSWRDPRLGVGLALVVASVLLGGWLFSRADATIEVYEAVDTLSPGDPLTAETLRVEHVRIDGLTESYLLPGDLAEGAVVTATVGAGELVPARLVGDAAQMHLRPIPIPTDAVLGAELDKGARVDVWVTPEDESSAAPEPVVTDVEVWQAAAETSVFASRDRMQLQVLVEPEDVSALLAALAGGGTVTVVPLLGGG